MSAQIFRIICLFVFAVNLAQAEPVQINSVTTPGEKFGTFVDLGNYQSYVSGDAVIPNLVLSPRDACRRVQLAWKNQFSADAITSMMVTVQTQPVAGGFLSYYMINTTATATRGTRQLNVTVMPNGDVIFPKVLKPAAP